MAIQTTILRFFLMLSQEVKKVFQALNFGKIQEIKNLNS